MAPGTHMVKTLGEFLQGTELEIPQLPIPSVLCDLTQVSDPKRERLIEPLGQKFPLGQLHWEGILGCHSLDHVLTLCLADS